jgi:hypothetical protein
MVRSEHRADRPHDDTGPVHRNKKQAEPLGFRRVRIGTRRQHAPGRHLRVGRPDLLSGDAPAVAVGNRAGAQRREIGSGFRLGESLTPDHFSARDGRQVSRFLLGRAVTHDRRPDPVDAHVLRSAGLMVGPHLFPQDGLLPYRTSAATMLFRPGEGQQPVGCQQFAKRLGGGEVFRVVGAGTQEALGDLRGDQIPQARSEFDGVGTEVVIHRHPFGNPSSRSAMMLRWISDVPP